MSTAKAARWLRLSSLISTCKPGISRSFKVGNFQLSWAGSDEWKSRWLSDKNSIIFARVSSAGNHNDTAESHLCLHLRVGQFIRLISLLQKGQGEDSLRVCWLTGCVQVILASITDYSITEEPKSFSSVLAFPHFSHLQSPRCCQELFLVQNTSNVTKMNRTLINLITICSIYHNRSFQIFF